MLAPYGSSTDDRTAALDRLHEYCSIGAFTVIAVWIIGCGWRVVGDLELYCNSVYRALAASVTLLSIATLAYITRKDIRDRGRRDVRAVLAVLLFVVIASHGCHCVFISLPQTVFNPVSIGAFAIVLNLTLSSFSCSFFRVRYQLLCTAGAICCALSLAAYNDAMKRSIFAGLPSLSACFFCLILAGVYSQRMLDAAWRQMTESRELMYADFGVVLICRTHDHQNIELVVSELLPSSIKHKLEALPVERWHEIGRTDRNVSVVFLSVSNLDKLSSCLSPADLVCILHGVFSTCDRALLHVNAVHRAEVLTKVEGASLLCGVLIPVVVKDQYLCCAGLHTGGVGAFAAATFVMDVINTMNGISVCEILGCKTCVNVSHNIKIYLTGGMHTGPVLSGTLARLSIFGSTVNLAARMMQNADVGTCAITLAASEAMNSEIAEKPNMTRSINLTIPGSVSSGRLADPLTTFSPSHYKMSSRPTTAMASDFVNYAMYDRKAINAKGLGSIPARELRRCTPYRLSRSPDYSSMPHSRSYSTLEEFVKEDFPKMKEEDSRVFYRERSGFITPPVIILHVAAAAFYAFFLVTEIMSWGFGSPSVGITFVAIMINISAPFVARYHVGRDTFNLFCACYLFANGAVSVIEGIMTVKGQQDRYGERSIAYYNAANMDNMAVVLSVTIMGFRLDKKINTIFSLFIALADYISMIFMSIQTWYLLMPRLLLVCTYLCVSTVLAHKMTMADKGAFSLGRGSLLSLSSMVDLVLRLIPVHVVKNLVNLDTRMTDLKGDPVLIMKMSSLLSVQNSGTEGTCTCNDYLDKLPWSRSRVSPLVACNDGSVCHWQAFDNLVFFALDIVNFTQTVATNMDRPADLFEVIRQFYSTLDGLVVNLGLWKMYTIGDAYIVAGGFPGTSSYGDPANAMIKFAFETQRTIADLRTYCSARNIPEFRIRIGIACGKATTAVVGENRPAFLVWGDAPSLAEQAEQICVVDEICIHKSFRNKYPNLNLNYRSMSDFLRNVDDEEFTYVVEEPCMFSQ